jgi:hypothetical protein
VAESKARIERLSAPLDEADRAFLYRLAEAEIMR